MAVLANRQIAGSSVWNPMAGAIDRGLMAQPLP